jgi:hypothetical protein
MIGGVKNTPAVFAYNTHCLSGKFIAIALHVGSREHAALQETKVAAWSAEIWSAMPVPEHVCPSSPCGWYGDAVVAELHLLSFVARSL